MRRAVLGVFQFAVAFGCLLAAAWIHYVGRTSVEGEFWLLLGFSFVVGLVLGRWWALLLAPLPWLAGVGYGLYTGRYLFLGEAWIVIWFGSALICLLGISVGWFAHYALAALPTDRPDGTERSKAL